MNKDLDAHFELLPVVGVDGPCDDLQVTRKALISLAGPDDGQPAAEPAGPSPPLPDHPACQQILDAFADLRRPLRARDLCTALDLPIAAKTTENIRSKLKRLASRGILIETEPGLFANHAHSLARSPAASTPNPRTGLKVVLMLLEVA